MSLSTVSKVPDAMVVSHQSGKLVSVKLRVKKIRMNTVQDLRPDLRIGCVGKYMVGSCVNSIFRWEANLGT